MAQLELMNAAANVTTKEDLDALKLTLSLFFAELAQKAIDKLYKPIVPVKVDYSMEDLLAKGCETAEQISKIIGEKCK